MATENRLIDANALMNAFRSYMVERYDKEKCFSEENCKTCEKSCLWRKIVSAAPTVDAVEVVRCKGCKSAEPYTRMDGKTGFYCKHPKCTLRYGTNWERLYMPIKEADDFCSYGERREGE